MTIQYVENLFISNIKLIYSQIFKNTLTIAFCNDKIAYTLVKKVDMEKFGAKDEHTEGICEVLRSIKPVEFAIVLKESGNNSTKVSMRSKEKDVTEIVKKFNGGGHIRAAGCTIKKPLNEALLCLLDEVKKHI